MKISSKINSLCQQPFKSTYLPTKRTLLPKLSTIFAHVNYTQLQMCCNSTADLGIIETWRMLFYTQLYMVSLVYVLLLCLLKSSKISSTCSSIWNRLKIRVGDWCNQVFDWNSLQQRRKRQVSLLLVGKFCAILWRWYCRLPEKKNSVFQWVCSIAVSWLNLSWVTQWSICSVWFFVKWITKVNQIKYKNWFQLLMSPKKKMTWYDICLNSKSKTS